MRLTVSIEQAGKRLDVVANAALPNLSRAFIQKLCQAGKVTLGGKPGQAGDKVRALQIITIDYDESAYDIPDITLPILYEDENCVVINKPAGVLTHALGKHGNEASVASFLRSKVSGLDGERAGIVHRLDRATSGVIIGAKNPQTLSSLQKQFSLRKVKKTYVAVVQGVPERPQAVIDMPIERNPKAPATFRAGPNGKPAVTHYKILRTGQGWALLELQPQTGRTHQLRVHLAKIGHPIIGDPLYGTGKYGDRLFLHAASLEITLPGGLHKTFAAPLPPEFEKAVPDA